ncbi:MAG: hypothetical protein ACM359_09515 [Bacillota bacterium]
MAAILEAMAERRERAWREAHFDGMSEAAREAHAMGHPVYGAVSQAAAREGIALKRIAQMRREAGELLSLMGLHYCARTPRTGRSAPDSPYVKIVRYPRLKAVKAWLNVLAGKRGSKDEIVTRSDRARRRNKRVARSLLRAAPALVQSSDGLQAMERLIDRIRRRQDGAAA